jgi:hypothetical protein
MSEQQLGQLAASVSAVLWVAEAQTLSLVLQQDSLLELTLERFDSSRSHHSSTSLPGAIRVPLWQGKKPTRLFEQIILQVLPP